MKFRIWLRFGCEIIRYVTCTITLHTHIYICICCSYNNNVIIYTQFEIPFYCCDMFFGLWYLLHLHMYYTVYVHILYAFACLAWCKFQRNVLFLLLLIHQDQVIVWSKMVFDVDCQMSICGFSRQIRITYACQYHIVSNSMTLIECKCQNYVYVCVCLRASEWLNRYATNNLLTITHLLAMLACTR